MLDLVVREVVIQGQRSTFEICLEFYDARMETAKFRGCFLRFSGVCLFTNEEAVEVCS